MSFLFTSGIALYFGWSCETCPGQKASKNEHGINASSGALKGNLHINDWPDGDI